MLAILLTTLLAPVPPGRDMKPGSVLVEFEKTKTESFGEFATAVYKNYAELNVNLGKAGYWKPQPKRLPYSYVRRTGLTLTFCRPTVAFSFDGERAMILTVYGRTEQEASAEGGKLAQQFLDRK